MIKIMDRTTTNELLIENSAKVAIAQADLLDMRHRGWVFVFDDVTDIVEARLGNQTVHICTVDRECQNLGHLLAAGLNGASSLDSLIQ